jgi:formylglycine-generating enzyme required for sulfatase activity
MRQVLIALFAFLPLLFATSTAQEPARFALLIGNKGYTQKVGPLKNPHHDVELVGASLTKLGFKATILRDATYKQMDTALKRYVTDVRRGGAGALSFFYYSGHGVANPETQINYLIPVDVADADDDKVWFESIQQNSVIDLLSKQAPSATHYLVFDACRNELNVTGSNAKTLGQDKGFVPLVDTSGLLIAYATAPKRTASDAGDGGGPYAKVLAEELVKPGVEAVSMFRNVQIRVKQTIGQDPWLSFPSLAPVYLAGINAVRPSEVSKSEAKVGPSLGRKPDPALSVMLGSNQSFRDPLVDGNSCHFCPEMAVVLRGSFVMGAPPLEIDEMRKKRQGEFKNEDYFTPGWPDDEGPQHEVTIARPFALGLFDVTFDEWAACVKDGECNGYMPSDQGWGMGRRPVINVSWFDAKSFLGWLGAKTGRKYRLPTEAEWEYSARAGTKTRYYWGERLEKRRANCDVCGSQWDSKSTAPTGSFEPNQFGLFEMLGNVGQWLEDCYTPSYVGAKSNGSSADENAGCMRVSRGGSWADQKELIRVANRWASSPDKRNAHLSFRVARDLDLP